MEEHYIYIQHLMLVLLIVLFFIQIQIKVEDQFILLL
jgi:hypothetical protein